MLEIDEKDSVRNKPRHKKSNNSFLIVLALLLIVCLSGAGWLYYHNSTHTKVPAADATFVIGQEATVCKIFVDAALECVSSTETNESVPRGELISQNVQAGATVKKDDLIELHYSIGPAKIALPEIRNDTVAKVQALVDPLGGTVVEKEIVNDSGLAEGRIVSSSIPAGGEFVNGAEVIVTISSGKISVPEWRGSSVKKVESDALDAGIKVTFSEVESDGPSGIVMDQDVTGLVPMDNTVNVMVSKQRAPKDLIVPKVIGLRTDAAQALIAATGFTSITVVTVVDETIDAAASGLVTVVVPAEGSTAKSNTQIDLTTVTKSQG